MIWVWKKVRKLINSNVKTLIVLNGQINKIWSIVHNFSCCGKVSLKIKVINTFNLKNLNYTIVYESLLKTDSVKKIVDESKLFKNSIE